MSVETIPALGVLSRLPIELRNMIYIHTFDFDVKHTPLFVACLPYPMSSLSLVNQTVADELTSLISQVSVWPCNHTHFTWVINNPKEHKPLPVLSHHVASARQIEVTLTWLGSWAGDSPPTHVTLAFPTEEEHWRAMTWSLHWGKCPWVDQTRRRLCERDLERVLGAIYRDEQLVSKAAAVAAMMEALTIWTLFRTGVCIPPTLSYRYPCHVAAFAPPSSGFIKCPCPSTKCATD